MQNQDDHRIAIAPEHTLAAPQAFALPPAVALPVADQTETNSNNAAAQMRANILKEKEGAPFYLHNTLDEIASTIFGNEISERAKGEMAQDANGNGGESRRTTSGGLRGYTRVSKDEKFTKHIAVLAVAYGPKYEQHAEDLSGSGSDPVGGVGRREQTASRDPRYPALSFVNSDGTFPPLDSDWQNEYTALPRLSTALRKAYILKCLIDDVESEITTLSPQLSIVADNFEQKSAQYERIVKQICEVKAAQMECLQRNPINDDLVHPMPLVQVMESETKDLREILEPYWRIEQLKCKARLFAQYGPYAVHYSCCNNWIKIADQYKCKFQRSIPLEAWPMSPRKTTEFYVSELRKLYERHIKCNIRRQMRDCTSNSMDLDNAVNIFSYVQSHGLVGNDIEELYSVVKRIADRNGSVALPPLKRRCQNADSVQVLDDSD